LERHSASLIDACSAAAGIGSISGRDCSATAIASNTATKKRPRQFEARTERYGDSAGRRHVHQQPGDERFRSEERPTVSGGCWH